MLHAQIALSLDSSVCVKLEVKIEDVKSGTGEEPLYKLVQRSRGFSERMQWPNFMI